MLTCRFRPRVMFGAWNKMQGIEGDVIELHELRDPGGLRQPGRDSGRKEVGGDAVLLEEVVRDVQNHGRNEVEELPRSKVAEELRHVGLVASRHFEIVRYEGQRRVVPNRHGRMERQRIELEVSG